ncbi:hypothetical protein L0F63_000299 [Massospora cicadina]|nr:hypothetical protein L0F63_000299 [Massospora cicadina]
MSINEQAVVYATLILADDKIEPTALEGKDISELLMNVSVLELLLLLLVPLLLLVVLQRLLLKKRLKKKLRKNLMKIWALAYLINLSKVFTRKFN